jgi:3,4-dihydroxy 2-butanone 4-phosphate synthase/GTP cyclohydrolase II
MNINPNARRVEAALSAMAAGKFVVVADSEDRENEGDLIMAAEKATPDALAFLVRHSSGIVCAPLPGERLRELGLPLMVARNTESQGMAFTVTVDLKLGTTTGISAADRAATIRGLANPGSVATDFLRPGHVFPLRASEGGVLRRPGHTEAALDLAQLAGLQPAGVLCKLVNEDGTMARGTALNAFAARYGLPFLTVDDLITYRRCRERIVERITAARLPSVHGAFRIYVFRSKLDDSEHVALVKGEVTGRDKVLVSVHAECFIGDIFGSSRCHCKKQLDRALSSIERAGAGVLVYLREPKGRALGFAGSRRGHGPQNDEDFGSSADAVGFDLAAQILTDLGLTTIRLISSNPTACTWFPEYDLTVVERVSLDSTSNGANPCNFQRAAAETQRSAESGDRGTEKGLAA